MTPAPRDIAATVNPGGQRPPAPGCQLAFNKLVEGPAGSQRFVTAAALTLLVAAAQFRQSASATTQATLSPAVGTCPAWGAATSPTEGCSDAQRSSSSTVEQSNTHGTLTGLANRLTSGWQFLLFDYSAEATRWASQPQIAKCLAEYLRTVSKAHHDAGGDSRVYVVAHSMGGLATLFAADGRFGDPAVASVMGGLVTLDTPFAGSAWGMTPLAAMLSEARRTRRSSNARERAPWRRGPRARRTVDRKLTMISPGHGGPVHLRPTRLRHSPRLRHDRLGAIATRLPRSRLDGHGRLGDQPRRSTRSTRPVLTGTRRRC